MLKAALLMLLLSGCALPPLTWIAITGAGVGVGTLVIQSYAVCREQNGCKKVNPPP